MERKKITFDSFIRGVILGVIIIGILMLLKRLSSVLLPFFIAWLIAYLVYPLVTFFQYKLKFKNRIVSIFCALVTLLIVGAGAFYLLVPPMIQECGRVQTLLVQYFSHGTYNSNVPTSLSDFLRDNIDVKFITELFNKENLLDALKEAVPRLWSLLSDSVDLLFSVFTIFIILLYVIFILLDYESIAEGWMHLVPMKYRSFVVGILNDVKVGMNRYFRGQAFVALCVGILFSIGFLIIDFPLAIGLGLFIGALNMVPYLQIIGLVPTIILAILKASDTGENFWIIIASAFYSQLVKMEGSVKFHDIAKKCVREVLLELIQNESSGRVSKHKWLTPEVISSYYAQSMCFATEEWISMGMTISPREMAEAYQYMLTRSLIDIIKEL